MSLCDSVVSLFLNFTLVACLFHQSISQQWYHSYWLYFLESGTIHVKRYYSYVRYYLCIRYYLHILYCSRETVGAIQEFWRCKGCEWRNHVVLYMFKKVFHKTDKSLRSLSFKWDHCNHSSLSWKLSYTFSHMLITIQGGTLACVQYLSIKQQQSMKLRSLTEIIFYCGKWRWMLYWGKIIA